jgi:y4mF family transcriptional regulator
METSYIAHFIRDQRNRLNLSQQDLAARAGVGLRFIRELEGGKQTVRLDKVNQVLALFGYSLIPGKELDPYEIRENYFGKNVTIFLKNKSVLYGFIIGEVRQSAEIKGWKFVSNNRAMEYQRTQNPDLVDTIEHNTIERIETI